MADKVTIDVRTQIEALENKEQQEATQQDHMGNPPKEDTGSEKSVKERRWLRPLKRAKHWQIDNIRLFLLKMVAIVHIKKSRVVMQCSKGLVHQELFKSLSLTSLGHQPTPLSSLCSSMGMAHRVQLGLERTKYGR